MNIVAEMYKNETNKKFELYNLLKIKHIPGRKELLEQSFCYQAGRDNIDNSPLPGEFDMGFIKAAVSIKLLGSYSFRIGGYLQGTAFPIA